MGGGDRWGRGLDSGLRRAGVGSGASAAAACRDDVGSECASGGIRGKSTIPFVLVDAEARTARSPACTEVVAETGGPAPTPTLRHPRPPYLDLFASAGRRTIIGLTGLLIFLGQHEPDPSQLEASLIPGWM